MKLKKKKQIVTKSRFVTRVRAMMLRQNKHFVLCIVGATGSGKSYAALRLGQKIDPSFNIDNVVFNPNDVISLVRGGKLEKGSVIVLDEAGVGFGSRDAMTNANRVIGKFLQTWRAKNMCLILTVPSFEFMDKQGRVLSHAIMRPLGLDRVKKLCFLKLMFIDHSPFTSVSYKDYMRVQQKQKDGSYRTFRLSKIIVGLPSKDLRYKYEIKKNLFLDKLYGKDEAETKLKANPKERLKMLYGIYYDVKLDRPRFNNTKGRVDPVLVRAAYPHIKNEEARLIAIWVSKKDGNILFDPMEENKDIGM